MPIAFIDPVFSSGVMLAMHKRLGSRGGDRRVPAHPGARRAALARFDRRAAAWAEAVLLVHLPHDQSPAMRELFLAPRNVLRMKEALLSLLAGDIFGSTPIWRSLRAFKGAYYAISLAHLGRSWRAARRRAFNMRPVESEPSTGG